MGKSLITALVFLASTTSVVVFAQPPMEPATNAPETNQPVTAAPANDTTDTITDKMVVPQKKSKFETTKEDAKMRHFKKEERISKDQKRVEEAPAATEAQ